MIRAMARRYLCRQRFQPRHFYFRVDVVLVENVGHQLSERGLLKIDVLVSLLGRRSCEHLHQSIEIDAGGPTRVAEPNITAAAVINFHSLKDSSALRQLDSDFANCLTRVYRHLCSLGL